MSEYLDELSFATHIAQGAGGILLERYERLERIDYKGPRDVVTEADCLAEAFILDAIRSRYPHDGILAEESGEHRPEPGGPVGSGSRRVWITDPLDGTINYANGIPTFCVSIALAVDGVPVVGAVFDPIRRESFAATATGSATLNGREIKCSDAKSRSDLLVATALNLRIPAACPVTAGKRIRIRSLGSAVLELAYVSSGRLDAFIQRGGLSNWDVAAAGLIAVRAGATVSSFDGAPWFDLARPRGSISVIGASPSLYPALVSSLPGKGMSRHRVGAATTPNEDGDQH